MSNVVGGSWSLSSSSDVEVDCRCSTQSEGREESHAVFVDPQETTPETDRVFLFFILFFLCFSFRPSICDSSTDQPPAKCFI